jgi:lysozyme
MKFNDLGLQLIKEFEGCSLVAYQDQGAVWTIGYGCTHGVTPGMTITPDAALERLNTDLAGVEDAVSKIVSVALSDNQFSAVVCFAYNVGIGNLMSSTLLKFLNMGHIDDAANEFSKWDKVNGTPNAGLSRRRLAEKALFLTPYQPS